MGTDKICLFSMRLHNVLLHLFSFSVIFSTWIGGGGLVGWMTENFLFETLVEWNINLQLGFCSVSYCEYLLNRATPSKIAGVKYFR